MEFKSGDKVISNNGMVYSVLKDTDINSPYVELLGISKGKYFKTITTKTHLIKKENKQ